MASIMKLEENVKQLKSRDKESYIIFNRIFSIYSGKGTMKIPLDLRSKVRKHFAATDHEGKPIESEEEVVNRIQQQDIVRIFNKWTGEGALFNHLRTLRPGMGKENHPHKNEEEMGNELEKKENKNISEREIEKEGEKKKLAALINNSKKNCDFCQPEKYTPSDVFSNDIINSSKDIEKSAGRIKGKYSITAANLAKYDVWSSLVIFDNHNPLEFDFEELSDYIDTGFAWFRRVFEEEPDYQFPFFVWNCLYKAGASQIHGHAQILMTRTIPYARMGLLHQASRRYRKEHENNYFNDLFKVHKALGLGFSLKDQHIYASLTPTKEKEIIIISQETPSENENSKKIIFNTLRCFIDVLGVHSFNLAIYGPPLNQKYEFPYLIKIVDRGNVFRPTSDMGGMELFGSTVVADDPYIIIQHLQKYLKNPEIMY